MTISTHKAVIFDKDGTLFDFEGTWNGWAAGVIDTLSGGDANRRDALAKVAHFDLDTGRFAPSSPIIAGTHFEAAACLAQALPGRDPSELADFLEVKAQEAALQPAVPLVPFLNALKHRGLMTAVMTNDTEASAHVHLRHAGVLDLFDQVIGFDSGHGAKPDAAPLLALARMMAQPASSCIMVGDSTHDLVAGRAAGMTCIGVLTGLAERRDLDAYADVVLPDIGHIPAWLDTLP